MIGETIAHYRILAKLGGGGMGEVRKVRGTRLDRIVALKRLKAEHSARFQQKGRAIAALNHPYLRYTTPGRITW